MVVSKRVMSKVLGGLGEPEITMLLDFFNPRDYYEIPKGKGLEIVRGDYGPVYYQFMMWEKHHEELRPLIERIANEYNDSDLKTPLKTEELMWDDYMVRESFSTELNVGKLASGISSMNRVTDFHTAGYRYRDTHSDTLKQAFKEITDAKDSWMNELSKAGILDYISFENGRTEEFTEILKEVGFRTGVELQYILGGLDRNILVLLPEEERVKLSKKCGKVFDKKGLEGVIRTAKKDLRNVFEKVTGIVPCDSEQLNVWGGGMKLIDVQESKCHIPLRDRHSLYKRIKEGELRGVKVTQPVVKWVIEEKSIFDYLSKFRAIYTLESFRGKRHHLIIEAAEMFDMHQRTFRDKLKKHKVPVKNILLEQYGEVQALDILTIRALERKLKN